MEFTDFKELKKLMANNVPKFDFEEDFDSTSYDNKPVPGYSYG